MSFLTVRDLHIALGEFRLNSVSMDLEQGDYACIIGPTGAGKTILLECLIGFYRPDRGRLVLEGRDITGLAPEKREIGIVYQDYALLPHMTVFQNIDYGLRKKETDKSVREQVIQEMTETLRIDHLLEREPTTLSGGEQQRVALARSLVVRPKLLLMDEPFSALDPGTRRSMRRMMREVIGRYGTTVIHITHDLDDAWSLADKVAFFRDGELHQFGGLEEIFHRPASRFIADFVGVTLLDGLVLDRSDGVTTVKVDGFALESLDEAEPGAAARVAVRPENIIVTRELPRYVSAQNRIEAELEEMETECNRCVLTLRAGETRFSVLMTNNAMEQMEVGPGDRVYALIKSANVSLV
jgi:molybdate transport system ATP-binding protein